MPVSSVIGAAFPVPFRRSGSVRGLHLSKITVPARRTRHVRFNRLEDPEPVPKGGD
jgi:hypothetical protein